MASEVHPTPTSTSFSTVNIERCSSSCIMPGGSRSRDGCFNCRKRKRRCDEEKPICRRCRKNGDDCVFPTPASASNPLKFVVAGSNHYMIPITQSPSFLNLSPRELTAVTDYKQGGVWVQPPLPRNLSPFGFESIGIENALVQYCMLHIQIDGRRLTL